MRSILDKMLNGISVLVNVVYHNGNRSVQCHAAFVIGDFGFFWAIELKAFTLVALA